MEYIVPERFSYFYLISGCAISDYSMQVEDNTSLPLRFS